jgi:hypothetical protein
MKVHLLPEVCIWLTAAAQLKRPTAIKMMQYSIASTNPFMRDK